MACVQCWMRAVLAACGPECVRSWSEQSLIYEFFCSSKNAHFLLCKTYKSKLAACRQSKNKTSRLADTMPHRRHAVRPKCHRRGASDPPRDTTKNRPGGIKSNQGGRAIQKTASKIRPPKSILARRYASSSSGLLLTRIFTCFFFSGPVRVSKPSATMSSSAIFLVIKP